MEVTREMVEEAFRNDHAATTVLLAPLWLQSHPDDLGIILNYAEMLYKMTRYEEAIGVYENALGKIEEDGRWAIYNQLGRMYQYWGHPARAEPWFRKAIEIEPDELASYMFLGACQARQGKLNEAEATHRAATQWAESWLRDEAYHNLGLVLRGQGRLSEAAECFRKAIEIDPKYADAIEALVDVEKAMVFAQGGAAEPGAAPDTAIGSGTHHSSGDGGAGELIVRHTEGSRPMKVPAEVLERLRKYPQHFPLPLEPMHGWRSSPDEGGHTHCESCRATIYRGDPVVGRYLKYVSVVFCPDCVRDNPELFREWLASLPVRAAESEPGAAPDTAG